MKKTKPTNFFNRIIPVWSDPNFLKNTILKQDDTGTTFGFWFFWNTILAIGATITLWFFGHTWIADTERELIPSIPEFEFTLENGQLSTNLPEPYVIEEANQGIFVLDTQETTYDESVLQSYPAGAFINSEKAVIKESTAEYQTIYFAEFAELEGTLDKQQTLAFWEEIKPQVYFWIWILAGVGIWLFLCVFRMITAIWWAFIFWAIGSMFKIPQWSFGNSYLAVLNFYIIPLVIEFALLIWGINIPFSTFIILGIIFGLNFNKAQQKKKKSTTKTSKKK